MFSFSYSAQLLSHGAVLNVPDWLVSPALEWLGGEHFRGYRDRNLGGLQNQFDLWFSAAAIKSILTEFKVVFPFPEQLSICIY